MLDKLVMLASYGYYEGGAIGSFLDSLGQAGFFSYLLPFLLIFALVFGILSRLKLFEETKMVNGLIALAVGLLSLQFDFVPVFFSEIFPRIGIGLAIILAILIIMGLFIPKATWVPYVLFGVSAVIVIVILVQSGDIFGGGIGYWFADYWPLIVGLVFIVVLVAAIVGSSSGKTNTEVPGPFFPWAPVPKGQNSG